MQISAATSDYDALVIEARGGNSAPLLRYLEDQGKQSALTPNQVADWLQVSSWVDNNDKATIEIWQRYRGQMGLHAAKSPLHVRTVTRKTGMIHWRYGKAFYRKSLTTLTYAPAG